MFRVGITAVLSVLAIAAAVLFASETQRSTAEKNFDEANIANQLLIGMLGQEDGLTDYVVNGEAEALGVLRRSRQQLRTSLRQAREHSSDDATELALLNRQGNADAAWERIARKLIAERRAGGPPGLAGLDRLDAVVARFTQANRGYQKRLATNRSEELHRAALVPLWLVLGLSAIFGGLAFLFLRRQRRIEDSRERQVSEERRAEDNFIRTQAHFAEALQVAQDQPEAQRLLKRHLESRIPASSIVVLNRNNSADRLEPAEKLPEDHPLQEPLEHAEPRSCLAVRLSRHYARGGDDPEILRCDVCSSLEACTTCQPVLVGGEVIGSVLVAREKPLGEDDERRFDDSVTQAAPVLANLRNLAIAEDRAATDPLTGLPNKRSLDDNFKRMLARAGRNLSPMSILMLDLDHFKKINDTYGHEQGDEVLAGLGMLLHSTLRAGDFPARSGGEEFIILLPDTDRSGGLKIAEELRQAIQLMKVGGMRRPITASIGLSTYPDEATDGDTLLRTADRALYAAKQRGRNRVETASRAVRGNGAEPDTEASEPQTILP